MTLQYAWAADGSEDHDAISKWVSLRSFGVPDNVWPGSASCGILKDGKPIAGFIFHDHKPSAGTIQFSGAATDKTWASGPSLHYLFGYMFDYLGCQMVTTGNAASNTGLHRILQRLGHRLYIVERGWSREEDLYFWTLTREDWLQNTLMRRSRKWAEEIEHV